MHWWLTAAFGLWRGLGSMKALRALEVASLGQQTAKERCEELPAVLWVLNSSNSPRGLVRLEPTP